MSTGEPPPTRSTLIGALCQGLRWEEFVALYGPLIVARARHDFGLQDCDAENVCQEVLIRVWKGIAGYNPARGRFRAWLYACTRNVIADLREQPRSVRLDEAPHANANDDRAMLLACARDSGEVDDVIRTLETEGFATGAVQVAVRNVRAAVRPATWKAFLLFEFFEMTAKEIAARLKLSPAAVNQGVYRIRRLLRQELRLEAGNGNHDGRLSP
jgi:RNA polymerase sigma-70 factor (ECF subfamily)